MKTNIVTALIWTVSLSLTLAWCQKSAGADNLRVADCDKGKVSIFVLPHSAKEGCDPFYPNSNRLYEEFAPPTKHTFQASELVLHGISGTDDHRLVIINNHTFAEGDEGEVITAVGRIHLRCVSIGANSAIVEVNGQRHELILSDK